jgi:hypothetical protein
MTPTRHTGRIVSTLWMGRVGHAALAPGLTLFPKQYQLVISHTEHHALSHPTKTWNKQIFIIIRYCSLLSAVLLKAQYSRRQQIAEQKTQVSRPGLFILTMSVLSAICLQLISSKLCKMCGMSDTSPSLQMALSNTCSYNTPSCCYLLLFQCLFAVVMVIYYM